MRHNSVDNGHTPIQFLMAGFDGQALVELCPSRRQLEISRGTVLKAVLEEFRARPKLFN